MGFSFHFFSPAPEECLVNPIITIREKADINIVPCTAADLSTLNGYALICPLPWAAPTQFAGLKKFNFDFVIRKAQFL
jgi:hypothetical protein